MRGRDCQLRERVDRGDRQRQNKTHNAESDINIRTEEDRRKKKTEGSKRRTDGGGIQLIRVCMHVYVCICVCIREQDEDSSKCTDLYKCCLQQHNSNMIVLK